jgi:transposase-like protein
MMTEISYSGYRFPPEIIQQAIWLYVRFTLSFRDVEDLLAERGIVVSHETVRFDELLERARSRTPEHRHRGRG